MVEVVNPRRNVRPIAWSERATNLDLCFKKEENEIRRKKLRRGENIVIYYRLYLN